ncbi:MAG: hypothetical protein HGJ97_08310 [Desulfosporosinus sp.]|nr:hypothetical protein [Desulfosporosinus sp.]
MTIVAAYRYDDTCIYVSDFRVTSRCQENRAIQDACLKFIDIDKRLGLFLAGDVSFWQNAVPEIQDIINSISYENLEDMEGPLKEVLDSCAFRHRGSSAAAIGFLINPNDYGNRQFVIRITPGMGSIISELPNNSCTLIGSGAIIPNIKDGIEERIEYFLKKFKDASLYELGREMRDEIKQSLKECGSSSFSKLGISSCMAISMLEKGYFQITGEEINGGHYSDTGSFQFTYSFTRDNNNQNVLVNGMNDDSYVLNSVTETTVSFEERIFDPERVEQGEDPSIIYLEANFVYLLHQWVVAEPSHEFIYRSLSRIDFVTEKRLCNKAYTFKDCIEDKNEIKHYPDFRDKYFVLEEPLLSKFEAEVNQSVLFNHSWLSQFISDYFTVLFVP